MLGSPHYRDFTITIRTPLDERSARHSDLYLTTHNTHKKQTSIPQSGFEPALPASERPHTHMLDRVATGVVIYTISDLYALVQLIIAIKMNGRGVCVCV